MCVPVQCVCVCVCVCETERDRQTDTAERQKARGRERERWWRGRVMRDAGKRVREFLQLKCVMFSFARRRDQREVNEQCDYLPCCL